MKEFIAQATESITGTILMLLAVGALMAVGYSILALIGTAFEAVENRKVNKILKDIKQKKK